MAMLLPILKTLVVDILIFKVILNKHMIYKLISMGMKALVKSTDTKVDDELFANIDAKMKEALK